MIDENLRNQVIKILEDEQNQLSGALDPQTGINVPETISIIETEENPDGTLSEKVTEEPSNYVNESIDSDYRAKFSDNADTLQQFCKIIDDKIISINVEINAKKQEIVTLSTEATNGNCWPGIAYSTPSYTGIFVDYAEITTINNEIENLRIYPNVAGPTARYDVKNPFEPNSVNELTSTNSGYGYRNLPDTVYFKNKDGSLTGSSADGSGEFIGDGRFDISTNLSDHTARTLSAPLYNRYPGPDNPPDASRCVAIANSISQIYSEIIELRNERDSLRSDLNTIKENKSQKELSAWGVKKIDQQIAERSSKNLSAIAAVKAFDSDVTVNVDALVLSLDAGNPDSYTGIGTSWNDLSGNGNNASLFPSSLPADYSYASAGDFTFNTPPRIKDLGIRGVAPKNVGVGFSIIPISPLGLDIVSGDIFINGTDQISILTSGSAVAIANSTAGIGTASISVNTVGLGILPGDRIVNGSSEIIIENVGSTVAIAISTVNRGGTTIPILPPPGVQIGDKITNNLQKISITGITTRQVTLSTGIGITITAGTPVVFTGNNFIQLADPLTVEISSGSAITFKGNIVGLFTDVSVGINTGDTLEFRRPADQYAQTGIKTTNILGIGNTWTVETWFKVNGAPSNSEYTNAIIDVNASNTTTNLLSVTYGQSGIFTGITTNRLTYTTSETGISTTHLVGTAITTGSWYHGVVVRNDTENTKLYINGNLVNTYTGNFPLGTASTTSVKIAAWTNEPVYSNVSVSVAKIYQKSHTDDEIKDKFDGSKGKYGIVG